MIYLFQNTVMRWMRVCFSSEIVGSEDERNQRFIEEALELVQSTGMTEAQAHAAVSYVFSRPVGEPTQEVGGVMVTLAALCSAHSMDLMECAEEEIERVNTDEVIEKIRAKQKLKPRF